MRGLDRWNNTFKNYIFNQCHKCNKNEKKNISIMFQSKWKNWIFKFFLKVSFLLSILKNGFIFLFLLSTLILKKSLRPKNKQLLSIK